MMLSISPTKKEAIHSIALHIVSLAKKNIAEKNAFTLVLSGGQTPEELYKLLAAPPFNEAVNWSKVFFFFGDERFVPPTDEESNYRMAAATLLTPLQIPPEQIFFIDTAVAINKAAELYQQKLKSFFGNSEMSFDLILLGLGENLHVASLFPHTAILHDTEPAVKAVKTDDKNAYRITMNAPLINKAKCIYFLVSGKNKASAIRQALKGPIDTDAFPVQLIKTPRVHWFIDKDAGTGL
ncbi:6-phosphogluconolactonase [Taibaiella lutea]|uniref:6-phosphogluconolactonase n=1 Tax=Taibaiella lutea TaxID=2608001 RepID=A0A5M6CC50_9BACT|nr:6-phosphogluconolactonase [Taibaiella lutea]KAA5532724.1 6-phosphogluconolactonase [Taibaiella lutea]